jgi:hypothetical protein
MLQQRPDQVKVIYTRVIADIFVEAASTKNDLPTKEKKVSKIACLFL